MPTDQVETAALTPQQQIAAVAKMLRWPLLIGFLVLAGPTLASLGKQVWTRESGAHGPIVVATGAWLIWRRLDSFKELARPGTLWLTAPAMVASLALYVFGRAFDFIALEAAGLYGVGISMLFSVVGLKAILRNWFPLFYLAFLVPPPEWFLDGFTGPLKQLVSAAATGALSAAGLPIGREGVTIYVAQYQLLVEDACSGMNSLTGLVAISLFYIYLLRGSSVRYSILLTAFVVPIAVLGNIVRVITLILMTYFLGDQVAQGFAHGLSGMLLFAVDLVLVFALDSFLVRVLPKSWRPAT